MRKEELYYKDISLYQNCQDENRKIFETNSYSYSFFGSKLGNGEWVVRMNEHLKTVVQFGA